MKIPFKPIKSKRISDHVFDQLRELIFRGEIKPGERILPERNLAEAFKVSRTSVRDAINKLVAIGLIKQRQGRGTFVTDFISHENHPLAIAMKTHEATLENLLEVRMGLECHAAAIAAQRADENDLHFLEKSIKELTGEVQSGRLGTEADAKFHIAIAYATKNPLQVFVLKNFNNYIFRRVKEDLAQFFGNPEHMQTTIDQHTDIFHSIKKRDMNQSFIAMKSHIEFDMDTIKQ